MSRKKKCLAPGEAAEALIRSAGSIGKLERLAGIGPDITARTTFWLPFAEIRPHTAGLDAGIAELKTRIRVRYANQEAPPC